ncbi:uncharacterized protein N7484_002233 [Penicillium longicatenatum]|uniref:uncharacterized protein n=1 Tax=Penicillium longicatenatum TaxID=1561947 RepID=UPI002549BF85|nr:uncharacterized protein N7484_002233 [Penicillium longicatenatum]KAJ5658584.1 hypothetical protein N7484_002233 [Penicillium longicatenatum]
MGAQRPVELSPQRWIMIQELLYLVQEYAGRVHSEFPEPNLAPEQIAAAESEDSAGFWGKAHELIFF